MKKAFLTLLISFCFVSFASAEQSDYAKYFEVDLDSPLPNLKELAEELRQQTLIYEPRYIVSWELGESFDNVFREVITTYGTSERRVKGAHEDDLYEMIASLPKEAYPYIGPYLHTVPGIDEKILNMPGIKETKNKFPERIAPELADVEDLEFLSPYLYILLMPEMWPDDRPKEQPLKRQANLPQIKYNPEFYNEIFKNIPEGGFGGAKSRGESDLKDKLRTLKVTKTSPLTTADVKAFLNTLDAVKAFSTHEHQVKLFRAETLLNYYEAKNNQTLYMNSLKDMVNPCQRLALKVKWAGLETEFSKSIAKEGFNLKDWALTCDKTIKAYRAIVIPEGRLNGIKQFRRGLYDSALNALKPKWRERQYATIYSVLEMYKTNKNDIFEALKNETEIKEKLFPFGNVFVISPLAL